MRTKEQCHTFSITPISPSGNLRRRTSTIARPSAWETASSAPGRVHHSHHPRISPANASAQGGWDHETGVIEREINAQIDIAFQNVERCLKDAGGKGWSQVFRINSYHIPLNDEAMEAMIRNMKKYMPDHKPLWTVIGVSRLGFDDMRVEIEVTAHDPEHAA